MRVAVDARELVGRPTGVGRYLSELLVRWSEDANAQRHEWHLFAHQPSRVPEPFRTQFTILPGDGGTQWEQWTLSRALGRLRPDVLFAPGYTAPFTAPCPTALTIHGVSFAAHPEWFSPREGFRRRTITKWSARRARVVLTDSDFSRREIAKHLGIPSDKVRVISLGLPPAPLQSRSIVAPTREPIVLYVGSIFRRRHVDTLIQSFAEHVAPRVPGSRLEIVGENRLYPRGDVSAALTPYPADVAARVTLRSYVDETTLADLYRRASVFAFLSEYEGFGLTPLEALREGVPSVVLDTPIAREIYGRAAHYVRHLTPSEIGDGLTSLLLNADTRASVLQHADAVLNRYDWSVTATTTLRAIEEAASV